MQRGETERETGTLHVKLRHLNWYSVGNGKLVKVYKHGSNMIRCFEKMTEK